MIRMAVSSWRRAKLLCFDYLSVSIPSCGWHVILGPRPLTWPPARHKFLFLVRTRNKRKGVDNERTDRATLCSSRSETEQLARLIGDLYPTSLTKAPYFVKPSSLSKTQLSMPRCDSGPSGLFPAGNLSIDVCYARRNTTSTVWESGGLDECHHRHAYP